MVEAPATFERSVARYHIVKPLKLGGTAAIYLAVMRGENNFSREVVIKRPLPHLVSDRRARLMFVDEAHIASRLNHPNICQVLDLVAREDELYLVLEYLRGVDLREILKRCIQLGHLMPPEVAIWMAIEIAAGLHSAHRATGIDGLDLGIVHRDVSPKNIRITPDGSVKIIDFGIARAQNRATETAAGTIKGTLGYMSPEQILGDDIDHRSDIFAYGIVLFQMLTCRNPFDGPTLKERVRRLTSEPIPSIRKFNPALDSEIEGIVARCLDRDIDLRYQDLAEVQNELDAYLARLQVVSPKRRLISFLEEIFPSLNDDDDQLKNVLTQVSTVTGRIDTEQRLRFPDDPPTETDRRAPNSETSATTPGDHSEQPTVAPQTLTGDRANIDRQDTAHVPPELRNQSVAVTKTVNAGDGRTVPLATPVVPVEAAPSPPRTAAMPWGIIGALLIIIAGLVAVVVVNWPKDQIAPLRPDATAQLAKPLTPVERQPVKPPAVNTGTATARPTKPPITKPPIKRPIRKPRRPVRKTPVAVNDRNKARLFFKTGARLGRAGQSGSARLMYTLAYAYAGKNPPSVIFLNLGILADRSNDLAKAKACLNAYLARNPNAANAAQIKMKISSIPPVKSVSCVSKREVSVARKRYARQGSKIDGWVDQTLKQELK